MFACMDPLIHTQKNGPRCESSSSSIIVGTISTYATYCVFMVWWEAHHYNTIIYLVTWQLHPITTLMASCHTSLAHTHTPPYSSKTSSQSFHSLVLSFPFQRGTMLSTRPPLPLPSTAPLPHWRPLTFSTSILASSPCLPTERNPIRLARSFTPIPYTLLLVPLLPQFSILLPTSTTPPSSSSSDVHLFHPPNYSHTKHIPISCTSQHLRIWACLSFLNAPSAHP